MSRDALTVWHPAPVRLMVPGGRVERLAFHRVPTPVELPRVDAGAPRLAHPGSGGPDVIHTGFASEDDHPPLWEIEGRLWARSSGIDGRHHRGLPDARVSLGMQHLEARVARGWQDGSWSSLDRFFHRTPMLGWHEPARNDVGVSFGRCLGSEGFPDGRVVEDLTDGARHALRDLFARSIRVAGDDVYHAYEGTHRIYVPARYSVPRSSRGYGFTTAPRNFGCRELSGTFLALQGREVPEGFHPLGPAPAATVPAVDGMEDVLAHANALPERVLAMVARSPNLAREVESAGVLLPWTARGSIGAIGRDEVSRALDDTMEVIEEARMIANALEMGVPWLDAARSYVTQVAIPALSAPSAGPEADDEDAMLGLGGP